LCILIGKITREDRIVIKALRVATQQPGLKPGGLCHLGGPAGARVPWLKVRERGTIEVGDPAGVACTVTEVH